MNSDEKENDDGCTASWLAVQVDKMCIESMRRWLVELRCCCEDSSGKSASQQAWQNVRRCRLEDDSWLLYLYMF